MIKTFKDSNPEELCKKVNEFMEKVKQDCPVQIHKPVQDIQWVAFVFYNKFRQKQVFEDGGVKMEKIGNGWKALDGKINLSLHNGRERINGITPGEERDGNKLRDVIKDGKVIPGMKIALKKEEYKIGPNSPDYIVYKSEE